MRTAVWLIASYIIAHAIFFGVGKYAKSIGVDRMPERSLSYSVDDLSAVASEARGYIIPVLFPLDLIVMITLSLVLAMVAAYSGPYGFDVDRHWILLILPAAYLLFDLLEDGLLVLLLSDQLSITARTTAALKGLTGLKLGAILLSELQAIGAMLMGAYRHWFM